MLTLQEGLQIRALRKRTGIGTGTNPGGVRPYWGWQVLTRAKAEAGARVLLYGGQEAQSSSQHRTTQEAGAQGSCVTQPVLAPSGHCPE